MPVLPREISSSKLHTITWWNFTMLFPRRFHLFPGTRPSFMEQRNAYPVHPSLQVLLHANAVTRAAHHVSLETGLPRGEVPRSPEAAGWPSRHKGYVRRGWVFGSCGRGVGCIWASSASGSLSCVVAWWGRKKQRQELKPRQRLKWGAAAMDSLRTLRTFHRNNTN